MRPRNEARTARYQSAAYRALLVRIGANVRRLREAKGWTQEEANELRTQTNELRTQTTSSVHKPHCVCTATR